MASDSSKSSSPHGHIDHQRDGARSFVITPPGNDLFVRTGNQIIEACQLGIGLEVWLQELDDMCAAVARWVESRSDVRSCYCAPVGQRIAFFFAPKSREFDFDLAEGLARLPLAGLRGFKVGMVELQQIPWTEMDRFFDVATAKRIAGEEFAAPAAVGA